MVLMCYVFPILSLILQGLDAFLAARASTIVDSRTDLSAPEKAYMRVRTYPC